LGQRQVSAEEDAKKLRPKRRRRRGNVEEKDEVNDELAEWQREFDKTISDLNNPSSPGEKRDPEKRVQELSNRRLGPKAPAPRQLAEEVDADAIDLMEAKDAAQEEREEHARLVKQTLPGLKEFVRGCEARPATEVFPPPMQEYLNKTIVKIRAIEIDKENFATPQARKTKVLNALRDAKRADEGANRK
jgi:hypothetical protein